MTGGLLLFILLFLVFKIVAGLLKAQNSFFLNCFLNVGKNSHALLLISHNIIRVEVGGVRFGININKLILIVKVVPS